MEETVTSARGKTGVKVATGAGGKYVESIVKDEREDEMNENLGYVLSLAAVLQH